MVENLAAVYAERFLSGMFSAAVTPVAAATIGNLTTTEQGRARRLAFVSMAGIAGFLLGPMLGVFVTRFAADAFTLAAPAGSVAIPLAATAVLAVLVASAVALAVPSGKHHDRSQKTKRASGDKAYAGIINAAKKRKCDVIFMASHGRRGLSKLMMGSVTQKVLAHSRIPVVVYR